MQESCLTQFGEQNVVTSLSCATGEVIGLAVLTRRTLFVVGSIVFVLLTGKCVYAYKIKKYRAQCVCIGLADAVIELAAVRLVKGSFDSAHRKQKRNVRTVVFYSHASLNDRDTF